MDIFCLLKIVCLMQFTLIHCTVLPSVDRFISALVFSFAGKEDGLEIWRYETTQPVLIGRSRYSKFHDGDSYILLSTTGKNNFNVTHKIYIWIGKYVNYQHIKRTYLLARILKRRLKIDSKLVKEKQGKESSTFLQLFPSGIEYFPGSLRSPLWTIDVDELNSPKILLKSLYLVKGQNRIFITIVKPVLSSLNDDDSFVADCMKIIYVYFGNTSSLNEKNIAMDYATWIFKNVYHSFPRITIVDTSTVQDFYSAFDSLDMSERRKEKNDITFEKDVFKDVSLFSIDRDLSVREITKRPFPASKLYSNESAILDTSWAIYVFKGYRCPIEYYEEALTQALILRKVKNYSEWIPFERISDYTVPYTFTQFFSRWSLRPPLPILTPIIQK